MKIEKLPSGSYRIRKMYKGQMYTIVTDYKPTQKEIIQLMADELNKVHKKGERMTFRTAAEKYVEMKTNVLSPASIREYSRTVNRLSADFTDKLLTDITALDVQIEVNLLSKTKSPKTVCDYHGFISAVLSTFCPSLKLTTTLPKKVKNEPYVPSDDDVNKVLTYSKGNMFEVAITLACFGLRRSEICALTPDDLDGNILTINKALVMDKDKNWVIKSTKTASSTRKIYLPDNVVSLIREKEVIYKGYPGSITSFLHRAQDELGIPRFSIHKLRHYYASMSHALGIPDSYIMDAGGWKTDNVLKTVYRHAMDDQKRTMQEQAAKHICDLLP